MRSIEYQTGIDFEQALRCVSFRIPREPRLKPTGMFLALALRYGLMGAAAFQHLLSEATQAERSLVLNRISDWPQLVADHVQNVIAPRLGMEMQTEVARQIGLWATHPVEVCLPLFQEVCPLEVCLEVAAEDFAVEHGAQVRYGWNILFRKRSERAFREVADDSVAFAKAFFERRRYDLEEVREIALLGE